MSGQVLEKFCWKRESEEDELGVRGTSRVRGWKGRWADEGGEEGKGTNEVNDMAEDGEGDREDGEPVQSKEGDVKTDDSLGTDARKREGVSAMEGDEGRKRKTEVSSHRWLVFQRPWPALNAPQSPRQSIAAHSLISDTVLESAIVDKG